MFLGGRGRGLPVTRKLISGVDYRVSPLYENMYSRLHFDDVMTQRIYGRFWLSSSTHLEPSASPSLAATHPSMAPVMWFKHVPISPDRPFPLRRKWWVKREKLDRSLLRTDQCGSKDWCVGYWFPARILWVIRSRPEPIQIFSAETLWKCPAAALNCQPRSHK